MPSLSLELLIFPFFLSWSYFKSLATAYSNTPIPLNSRNSNNDSHGSLPPHSLCVDRLFLHVFCCMDLTWRSCSFTALLRSRCSKCIHRYIDVSFFLHYTHVPHRSPLLPRYIPTYTQSVVDLGISPTYHAINSTVSHGGLRFIRLQ